MAGGQPCVANVRPAAGSTANDPGIRGDMTAFGEDMQRGYDQTAFFGSVDFDIIPKVLTVTAGTRWYHYSEFEVGSQYGTGHRAASTCRTASAARHRQHQLAQRPRALHGASRAG